MEVIYQKTATEAHELVFIFVVPGIGTSSPDAWHCAHQTPWLESLVEQLWNENKACTVLVFKHGLVPENVTRWENVLEQGSRVLQAIELYRRKQDVLSNPILIVCHSLGGIIVKQALIHAWRLETKHQGFFDVLSGLVFLSTPHLPEAEPDEWYRPLAILKTKLRSPTSDLALDRELRVLVRVCTQFEDLTPFIPILSTWEKKETKLKGLLIFKEHHLARCILVDQNTGVTHAGLEETLAIENDHEGACLMDERSGHRGKLVRFILECFRKACSKEPLKAHATPDFAPDPKIVTMSAPDLLISLEDAVSPPQSQVQSSKPDEKLLVVTESRVHRHPGGTTSLPELSKVRRKRKDPKIPCMSIEAGCIISDFFARNSTMEQIDSMFSAETSVDTVNCVVLHGIGGMGKTSVAAEYMRTRTSYEARFFVRADTHTKLMESYARMAVMLRLVDESRVKDRWFAKKLVLDWLESPLRSFSGVPVSNSEYVRWLLVFDNVDNQSILRDFWPKTGGGSIIVTSRNEGTAWQPEERGLRYKGIEVEPFDVKNAAEFLCRVAPDAEKPDRPTAAADLAKRLDCIPLALRQIGGIVHRRRMTFAKFLEIYKEESSHARLYQQAVEQGALVDYEHNLWTVWSLKALSGPALTLINVISLLDPDHIRDDTLVVENSDVKLVEQYPSSADEYYEARGDLLESSLIAVDKQAEEISLHRTVQDAARAQMSPSQFQQTFELVAQLLLSAWPLKGQIAWHYPIDHWETCEALSSHLVQIHQHYRHNKNAIKWVPPSANFTQLLTYAGWYSHERGDFDQAKSFFKTAESLCYKAPELDHDLLRALWRCQGCVATETNDPKRCIEYYEKLLEETEKRITSPRTDEQRNELAIAYNEMGIAHLIQGDLDTACELLDIADQYTRRRGRTSETAASVQLLAAANLGLAYWLKCELEDSLNILFEAMRVIDKNRNNSEKDSFVPGRIMHAIGNVKITKSENGGENAGEDFRTGFDWHRKAYDHYMHTVGEGHHRTADVLHRLGDDYYREKLYSEAEECIKQALTVFDSKPCYTPEKARTTNLLAKIRFAQGDADDALNCLAEVKKLHNEIRKERGEPMSSYKNIPDNKLDADVMFWSL